MFFQASSHFLVSLLFFLVLPPLSFSLECFFLLPLSPQLLERNRFPPSSKVFPLKLFTLTPQRRLTFQLSPLLLDAILSSWHCRSMAETRDFLIYLFLLPAHTFPRQLSPCSNHLCTFPHSTFPPQPCGFYTMKDPGRLSPHLPLSPFWYSFLWQNAFVTPPPPRTAIATNIWPFNLPPAPTLQIISGLYPPSVHK